MSSVLLKASPCKTRASTDQAGTRRSVSVAGGSPDEPLGINARFAGISEHFSEHRWIQYRVQAAARRLFKQHRDQELIEQGYTRADLARSGCDSRLGYHGVTRCLWSRWNKREEGINVAYSEQYARAGYKGLITCASWSACPVCLAKISERRRIELQATIKAARAKGYVVAMVTLTQDHTSGDDLTDLVDRLNNGYRQVKTTRAWKRIEKQYGIEGPSGRAGGWSLRVRSVRAFETTWGYNGWHPHLHVIFILPPGSDVSLFGDELRDLWYDQMGGTYSPDPLTGELLPSQRDLWDRCCKVTCNDGEVADYVTKWGHDPRWDVAHEVAKSNSKHARVGRSKHYTVADLLFSYSEEGNKHHGQLYLEFGLAMKGRKQLVWSPGLREMFDLGQDQTDEEVAADVSDLQRDLATLDDLTWNIVRRSGERADLLEVADGGDPEKVLAYLDEIRALYHHNGGARPPVPLHDHMMAARRRANR